MKQILITILFLFFITSCEIKENYRKTAEEKIKLVEYKNGFGEKIYEAGYIDVAIDGWSLDELRSKKFKSKEDAVQFRDSLIKLEINNLKSEFKIQ